LVTIVYTAISYVVSMIMGGKAAFGKLYYMISLPFAPLYTISGLASIVFMVIGVLVLPIKGVLGMVSVLVTLLLAIYGLYLVTLSLDSLYKYGKLKAVVAWLVPTMVLAGIVLLILGAAFLSMIGLVSRGY